MACIYSTETGRYGAEIVLQVEIKLCNIWESSCQN